MDLDATSTQTLNSNFSNGSTPIINRFTSFRRYKSYNKYPKTRTHHSFYKEHKNSFESPKMEKAKSSSEKINSGSQISSPNEKLSTTPAVKTKNKICLIM